jgi:hypothetical protein
MRALVIGDSWASAVEGDTGLDRGWPDVLGIEPEYQQAVAGSTAEEWYNDKNGTLTKAMNTEADTVIISLMGNDARNAMSDGKITSDEIFKALTSMCSVMNSIRRRRTLVFTYADPYDGKNTQFSQGLPLLNGAIQLAAGLDSTIIDLSEVLTCEHFDGRDFHPIRAGHAVIAEHLRGILDNT